MALGDLPTYDFTTTSDMTNPAFSTFYGSYRYNDADVEENDGTRLTIEAGYVDPQLQIQNMILSGEKLNSARMFDDEEALTNDEFATQIATIRHPNTDITDLQIYTENIETKIRNARSEAERKAAKESLEVGTGYPQYEKKTPETPPSAE